jgi:uncharacterized protein YndB with AHSA1/START domain
MSVDAPLAVSVARRFHAPPEQVFDAWLDPAIAGRWLFATDEGQIVRTDIDARAHGRFVIVDRRAGEEVEHAGEYLEIDRPRRLVFTFGLPGMSSHEDRVDVDFHQASGGCEVTITHEMDPQFAAYAARTEQGWARMLDKLARTIGDS